MNRGFLAPVPGRRWSMTVGSKAYVFGRFADLRCGESARRVTASVLPLSTRTVVAFSGWPIGSTRVTPGILLIPW